MGKKEGYPTLSYSVTCAQSRRIIAATKGFPGATNDKTISKYDIHLQGFCSNSIYPDVSFILDNCQNDDKENMQHPWLLCDGGYHKWRSMQCPVKHTSDEDLCRWSRWVESVRIDVECKLEILKGRFRILKIPVLLQS